MAIAKKAVIAEVKRFAVERDAIFDRTKEKAGAAFAKQLNVDAIMANPAGYLKLLFTKVGVQVVKEMMPEAQKAGKKHAERLFKTTDSNA